MPTAEPQLCIVHNYLSLKGQVMSSLFLYVLYILGVIALASGQEQLLMVFGGLPWRPNVKNVTLLSLDGGPPVPECLQNLNRHPRGLRESCPAALGDGKLQMNLEKPLISNSSPFCIILSNRQNSSRLWR